MGQNDNGGNMLTIGLYTAGVFFAILIVFIILITIEKVRRKRKRITEVVSLPEYDLDKHYENIKHQIEAGTIVNFSPKFKPDAKKLSASKRIPVPIHQNFKDDVSESSRGGTGNVGATQMYKSN